MMKVYLYFSENKILEINNLELVKKHLATSITSAFGVVNEINPESISIKSAKLRHDIDMYLVMDKLLTDDSIKLFNATVKIKSDLADIIHKDQDSNEDYKIGFKVDPNYTPVIASVQDLAKESAPRESEDKTAVDSKQYSELDYEKRAKQYVPVNPSYSFDRVILPEEIIEKLEEALSILKYEKKVFDKWGLYEIQPRPSSSLSFFGPSGTGKTMAAEAIADKLGKKILKVSYADVESKYHGEGPKMVKAIFLAAEKEDAVLFFDEADSLLSKRLTNVSQGSEQAINSMRSQLLICLEEFRGIVVFATNLVVNYDSAFLTRLINIEFKKPDLDTRKKIWDVHIRPANDGRAHRLNIPLADDVDTSILADRYDFSGREIRNAVISACISAAMHERDIVSMDDFVKACDKLSEEKKSVANASDYTVSDESKEVLKNAVLSKMKEKAQNESSTITVDSI